MSDCRFCGDASLNDEPSVTTIIGESRDEGERVVIYFFAKIVIEM